MFIKTIACLSLASIATAHFSIEYPEWRGDSFATGASQWLYPCKLSSIILSHPVLTSTLGANVNQTATTNRTLWPLTGGSLTLDLHHPWTYVFVNLGLGTDYPTFNISLTTQLLNETGNGTLCLPKMTLPASVTPTSGQNASIQVVTIGQTGSALYNASFWPAKKTKKWLLTRDSARISHSARTRQSCLATPARTQRVYPLRL